MNMGRISTALILTCAQTSNAAPMSPTAHTRTFCDLAIDLGYASRGYNVNTAGCASDMTPVTPTPGRNGLRNNLAFYSMSTFEESGRLMQVSLILNVNNTHEQVAAHAELARVASGVATKLLGKVPDGLEKAIQGPTIGSWISGEWLVEVRHDTWRTGLGHDITVYFRKATGKWEPDCSAGARHLGEPLAELIARGYLA